MQSILEIDNVFRIISHTYTSFRFLIYSEKSQTSTHALKLSCSQTMWNMFDEKCRKYDDLSVSLLLNSFR